MLKFIALALIAFATPASAATIILQQRVILIQGIEDNEFCYGPDCGFATLAIGDITSISFTGDFGEDGFFAAQVQTPFASGPATIFLNNGRFGYAFGGSFELTGVRYIYDSTNGVENTVAYLVETIGATRDGLPIGFSVPEPGTWALLILGFGMVGGAMRRRGGAHAHPRTVTGMRVR